MKREKLFYIIDKIMKYTLDKCIDKEVCYVLTKLTDPNTDIWVLVRVIWLPDNTPIINSVVMHEKRMLFFLHSLDIKNTESYSFFLVDLYTIEKETIIKMISEETYSSMLNSIFNEIGHKDIKVPKSITEKIINAFKENISYLEERIDKSKKNISDFYDFIYSMKEKIVIYSEEDFKLRAEKLLSLKEKLTKYFEKTVKEGLNEETTSSFFEETASDLNEETTSSLNEETTSKFDDLSLNQVFEFTFFDFLNINFLNINLLFILSISFILFFIGAFGLMISRKNLLLTLFCFEIILVSLGLSFVTLSFYLDDSLGQLMFLIILGLGAADVSIALALLVRLNKVKGNIFNHHINSIKG